MTTYIGIGEYAVSGQPGEVLRTLALGPCVGVVVFSKKISVVGLLHVQLPESSINLDLAAKRPAVFADTGIPLFLSEFAKFGCRPAELMVKLVGGAQVMDSKNTFNIGKRNYLAVKKILWANRLWPLKEEVGGTISRSVTIEVGKTDVTISTPGIEERII
jgi:chemotaxis protein CheD